MELFFTNHLCLTTNNTCNCNSLVPAPAPAVVKFKAVVTGRRGDRHLLYSTQNISGIIFKTTIFHIQPHLYPKVQVQAHQSNKTLSPRIIPILTDPLAAQCLTSYVNIINIQAVKNLHDRDITGCAKYECSTTTQLKVSIIHHPPRGILGCATSPGHKNSFSETPDYPIITVW